MRLVRKMIVEVVRIGRQFMKINYTRHAKERMDERGVASENVRRAVEFPDKVGRSLLFSARFIVKKVYYNAKLGKKHLLMVIYEERKSEVFVITIIDTYKIDKYY